jgi:hypothetical protein
MVKIRKSMSSHKLALITCAECTRSLIVNVTIIKEKKEPLYLTTKFIKLFDYVIYKHVSSFLLPGAVLRSSLAWINGMNPNFFL